MDCELRFGDTLQINYFWFTIRSTTQRTSSGKQKQLHQGNRLGVTVFVISHNPGHYNLLLNHFLQLCFQYFELFNGLAQHLRGGSVLGPHSAECVGEEDLFDAVID